MTTPIFLAVLVSAFVHAAWNIAAERVAGDIGVLWVGQVLAAVLLLPVVIAIGDVFPTDWTTLRYLALTAMIQAVYFGLLSKAYRHGDISVVVLWVLRSRLVQRLPASPSAGPHSAPPGTPARRACDDVGRGSCPAS